MKITDQVISFEQAKRLNELGIRAKSLFIWAEIVHPDDLSITEPLLYLTDIENFSLTRLTNKELIEIYDGEEFFESGVMLSAYTLAELGEMLPVNFLSGKVSETEYDCIEINHLNLFEDRLIHQPVKEVDARAKVLIHLLESGRFEVEK